MKGHGGHVQYIVHFVPYISVYNVAGVDVWEGGEELYGVAGEAGLAVAGALHQPVQQTEPRHPAPVHR